MVGGGLSLVGVAMARRGRIHRSWWRGEVSAEGDGCLGLVVVVGGGVQPLKLGDIDGGNRHIHHLGSGRGGSQRWR